MTDELVPLDKIVKAFLRIRDRRAELKTEWESEDTALKEAQSELQAHMLNQMNETGITSFRTKYGTVYRSESIKPAAYDWDAFYKYVAENDAFEALEKRIKTTFVSAYMEQNNGEAPPGVSVIRAYEVNVRRKN